MALEDLGRMDAVLEDLRKKEPIVAMDVARGWNECETIWTENGLLVRHFQGMKIRIKAEIGRRKPIEAF